jgi:hypothetical protein
MSQSSFVGQLGPQGATGPTGPTGPTGATGVTGATGAGGAGSTDGWIDDTAETWTYASGSGGGTATFTVSSDVTAKYTPGTRIKLTQTTVKYFVVTASSVAAGTTTVTITAGSDYTLANAAISANNHSYAANPQGYPGWFTFAPAATGFTGAVTVVVARFHVVGRQCTIDMLVTGTSNSTASAITLPISSTTQMRGIYTTYAVDNAGTPTVGTVFQSGVGSSLSFFRNQNGDNWTASGTKSFGGVLAYEI